MSEEPFMVNGQFIDTREPKTGFLETNNPAALTFYRCALCRKVNSLWDLRKHKGCHSCGHARMSPTNLTFIEKVVQIAKHPKVWTWQNQKNQM